MAIKIVSNEAAPVKKTAGELAAIMAAINKKKPNVLYMGSDIPQVQRLATGVFEFDDATGGGFPRSRISIVYGPESSGKTNIALCAAATAQAGPPECNKVVWFDLEGTFDPKWARKFSVNTDELIVVKPSYGEEAVDLCDALIRAGDVALLVVDSVAAVVSSKEVGQSVETMDVQGISTLVKRLCNKFAIALSEEGKRDHNPAIILLNQTRFKIGQMFGDPETMPGGQTMKFLSSLTVRLYGKNKMVKEISSELAAFKDTSVVIKKAKVPVKRLAFSYDMALIEQGGLSIGDTDSFNMVKSTLQSLGLLAKAEKGGGWVMDGKNYATIGLIQDTYQAEKEFAKKLQGWITQSGLEQAVLVEQAPEEVYTGPLDQAWTPPT